MNKDIHCLKKWDEVIIFNNEIFYTPPIRFCLLIIFILIKKKGARVN